LVYFFIEIWKLIEPSHKWSYFFNNEEAYLSFDCHPNSIPGTKVDIWEYVPLVIFLILPTSLYPLSNAGIASPIVFLVAQIVLLIAYLKNISNNEWREDFSLFNFFKFIGTFCRIVCGLVLLTMWILPETLTLFWIKMLTWLFVGFYQLDLLMIIGEVLSRVIYLVLESQGDVKFKEYKPIRLTMAKEKYIPRAQRGKKDGYDDISNGSTKSNKIHPLPENTMKVKKPMVDKELANPNVINQTSSKKPEILKKEFKEDAGKTKKRTEDRKKSRSKSKKKSSARKRRS
jgi:hypothetical protein